jgi:hypothetical protein
MKLAVISNTKCLQFVGRMHLSYHMALGQWLVIDREYREWYREAHLRGEFIMVDNGAAEPEAERVPFQEIVRVADYIGADEIVMPDVIRDRRETTRMFRSGDVMGMVPPYKRVLIPQGESLEEWRESCCDILALDHGFATLGIPKHLERFDDGRKQALQMVEQLGMHAFFNIHMFGVWRNPFYEIKGTPPWVRGIDSGAPIAYAQAGARIDCPDHFSLSDLPASDRLVEVNIQFMRRWCNDQEARTYVPYNH